MKARPQDIRVDALAKLQAQVQYIKDVEFSDLWHAVTVRSSYSRAEILNISFSGDFDWRKVVVVTAEDVPQNYVAITEKDMPYLAENKVNYLGEPVVLVAAPTAELAAEAAENIQITYRELPPLLDMHRSFNSEIKIFGDDNVFKHIVIEKGNLEEARNKAYKEISLEAETGYQEQMYIEPQGVVAVPGDNAITIHGSMQCPYYVKGAMDSLFDGKKKITVIQTTTGGAFGGKEEFPSLIAGHAALLAAKSGHPVAVFYDREEDIKVTTKRHPSYHRDTVWVDRNGKILGLEMDILFDGGAYCTLSQVVLSRGALTATGSYYVPNVKIDAKAVATNTPPNGAFRGFGGPQAIFAVEMLMEKIALELQLPPDEVRKINLIKEGETTATGQILKYSVSSDLTFDDVILESDYRRRYKEYQQWNRPVLEKLRRGVYPVEHPEDKLKGIGLSVFLHGAGFTGTGENKIKGKIRVELDKGRPVIFAANTEMGQGKETAFRKMLADTLNVPVQDVWLAPVNTDLVPDSGPTVASRSTMIVGSLLVEAGKELITILGERLKDKYGADFIYREGYFYGNNSIIAFKEAAKDNGDIVVHKQYTHPDIIKFDENTYKGDAYPAFSWGAAVADLEVDPLTFEVEVKRYITSQEIGKAINYDQAVAQIQGGSLQGIGYALYEKIGLRNGQYDVSGFADYIVPTTADMPEFVVNVLENPYPFGPFGAKGLGELPLGGAPPAIVSALTMIFGKVITHIPVMPEDLYKLI